MLIKNDFEVAAPVEKVWQFFDDIPQVAACLPGTELTKDLGDDSFKKRESASMRLTAIGTRAVPLLREATSHRDIEVVARARSCLAQIKLGSVEALLSGATRAPSAPHGNEPARRGSVRRAWH